MAVIDDCIKYVLNEEFPAKIIDIDEYIDTLRTESFDRNEISISNALNDLPDSYKNELTNRLFTIYIDPRTPSTLSSNIEFIAPLLWKVISKDIKIQITRRVDQEIPKGNVDRTTRAFNLINTVDGNIYLSITAKRYILKPLIDSLKNNMDQWAIENQVVKGLYRYRNTIPEELIDDYVWGITHTYIGYVGSSLQFSRTDFYADGAAYYIPDMFQAFNDRMVDAFINTIKTSKVLISRIHTPSKMNRLRTLGTILSERISTNYEQKPFLELLLDNNSEESFFRAIKDK